MNLQQARAIFRLDSRISMEELNGLFRTLVKKYHPDKVRDHPEWAHARMTEINDAYELLVKRITSPVQTEPEENPVDREEPNDNTDTDSIWQVPPMDEEESRIFYPLFNDFLDGLGLYYQYGLENPPVRMEGIRRFRYREAMRTIIRGRDSLAACRKIQPHPVFSAASRFARLTTADIDLGEIAISSNPLHRKYDKRMINARRSFDESIKVILFPELVPHHLHSRSYSGLYSCYSEFVIYFTVFEEGERRKAGILQAARYDAFMTLVQMRNARIMEF